MWLEKLGRSFRYAGQGFKAVFRQERNLKIHVAMAFFVFLGGFWLRVSRLEFCVLIAMVGLVIAAELFNSCVERIIDLISPQQNKLAGQAKDIAAAAVLCSAIAALMVGLLIFIPHLFEKFTT